MITNGDTITVAEWADESALSRSARSTRKLVLSPLREGQRKDHSGRNGGRHSDRQGHAVRHR